MIPVLANICIIMYLGFLQGVEQMRQKYIYTYIYS